MSEAHSNSSDVSKLIWIGGLTFAAMAIGAFSYRHIMDRPLSTDLRSCEETIRATLKAPSTFKLIEAPDYYIDGPSRSYFITYEAQNSFGVPLQSKGMCTINGQGSSASAEWNGIDL